MSAKIVRHKLSMLPYFFPPRDSLPSGDGCDVHWFVTDRLEQELKWPAGFEMMHFCHIAGASDHTTANCRMWFCSYYDALTLNAWLLMQCSMCSEPSVRSIFFIWIFHWCKKIKSIWTLKLCPKIHLNAGLML